MVLFNRRNPESTFRFHCDLMYHGEYAKQSKHLSLIISIVTDNKIGARNLRRKCLTFYPAKREKHACLYDNVHVNSKILQTTSFTCGIWELDNTEFKYVKNEIFFKLNICSTNKLYLRILCIASDGIIADGYRVFFLFQLHMNGAVGFKREQRLTKLAGWIYTFFTAVRNNYTCNWQSYYKSKLGK